jgi:hypothetical protein
LKKVFDKYDIIDQSVYDRNRRLFTPMNKIKKDDVVPEFKIVNGEIFDNCATYIKEDYVVLDLKIDKKKDVKEEIKFNDDLCNNTETSYGGKLNFTEIISKLRTDRVANYND